MPESFELSRAECDTLLRAGVAGRVAFAAPDGPHILPVHYSVVDEAIVIRTSPFSPLGTHGVNTMLAFEVDQLDHEDQCGWSVTARGRSEVVHDLDELEHIRAVWSPRPWASGVRRLVIRLPIRELTGRRLGSGWDPVHEMPVRRVV
jgi:uncharacterized protein